MTDWPSYCSSLFKHTSPGGWVELGEHSFDGYRSDDNSIPADSNIQKYVVEWRRSMKASGFPYSDFTAEDFKGFLEGAGFVDVEARVLKMPWVRQKICFYLQSTLLELPLLIKPAAHGGGKGR